MQGWPGPALRAWLRSLIRGLLLRPRRLAVPGLLAMPLLPRAILSGVLRLRPRFRLLRVSLLPPRRGLRRKLLPVRRLLPGSLVDVRRPWVALRVLLPVALRRMVLSVYLRRELLLSFARVLAALVFSVLHALAPDSPMLATRRKRR